MVRCRALSLLLCAFLAAPVQAAGVYKWVDKDGNVHFGDQPQAAEAAEMKLPNTQAPVDPALQERLQRQKQYLDARQEDRDEAKRKAGEEKAQKAERQTQCNKAKEQLAYMESHARLYRPLPNGERQYLSDAEREAELEKTRQQVAELCR